MADYWHAAGPGALTDFERLPFTKVGHRAGHESSFDRTGGNDDFGNVPYVQPGGEKVLLDLKGPGCVHRLWFTAYTPSALIRVYFDDEPEPRIELPMGEAGSGSGLFGGEVPPFVPPLVADARIASGGAYSYVPLPFQRAVRVTTTDPSPRFYYNIDYHLLEPDDVVTTWTGREDLSAVRALWNNAGEDPKPQAGVTTTAGTAAVPAGDSRELLDLAGPRQISAIVLAVPGLLAGQATANPVTSAGRAHVGASEFTVAVDPANEGVVLTRRLNFGIADQKASVYVDGTFAGTWWTPGSTATGRWRDSDFALPASATAGKERITVRIVFASSTVDWNEFAYRVTSKVAGGGKQTDTLDIGHPADESAHGYVITRQTWAGTRSFTYPASPDPADSGRRNDGSSRFTVAVDPANQGVVLFRRLDYSVPDQKAAVFVDGELVGDWTTPGSDQAHAWRDHGFAIPPRFTSGRSALVVRLVTAEDASWTEYRYWTYSKVDATRILTDEVDISDAASESAHDYAVTGRSDVVNHRASYPPPRHYQDVLNNVWLQIAWDDEPSPSVDAPLGSLFGMGQFGAGGSRGLGAGIRDDGGMYLYFPMPFARRGRLRVVNDSGARVDLGYRISHQPFPGSFAGVGYFTTAFRRQLPTTLGEDVLLLETTGAGQVVGVVQSVQGAPDRWYLEGDERAMIDGCRSPAVHGTGTEDFYNGAFYFENGPYTQPVSGNPVHLRDDGSDSTAMYRQFVADAVPFRSHLRLTIEHGGTNDTIVNVWTLVYYYLERAAARLDVSDTLVVGDDVSEIQHTYAISQQTWLGRRTFTFEGENDDVAVTATGRAHTGTSEFTMKISPDNRGVTLRRMFDQGVFNQHATVSVDGAPVGSWFMAGGNGSHRWREEDFAIPARYTSGKRAVRITVEFASSTVDWNEFRYQALSLLPGGDR